MNTIRATVHVSAWPMSVLADPLSSVRIADVKDGALVISLKSTPVPDPFETTIRVVRTRSLARDALVAVRRLPLLAMKATPSGAQVRWQMDLKDIGIDWAGLPTGSYRITVTLRSTLDLASVVNPKALPEMSRTESVTFEK